MAPTDGEHALSGATPSNPTALPVMASPRNTFHSTQVRACLRAPARAFGAGITIDLEPGTPSLRIAQRSREPLTEKDLAEVREYNKIIAFNKLVTSGKHPKHRIPQHVLVCLLSFSP